eukprot:m.321446 g.321446  ORF g.321446 m.321446 type:complete len:64 (-) comp16529_c0_seq26:18-209(-)
MYHLYVGLSQTYNMQHISENGSCKMFGDNFFHEVELKNIATGNNNNLLTCLIHEISQTYNHLA